MKGHKGTILAVDDESDSLRHLTDVLTAQGYQVLPANSGPLALASLASVYPELIMLDIRMPGMDGFEVCRRIKASEKTRGIPVIFISSSTDEEEHVEGFSLGAVDFITKPLHREELLARVSTHLKLGRLQTRLEEEVAERTRNLNVALEHLQQMASKLLTAQEEERRHISRELHDDIVQKIAALAIGLSRIKNQLAAAGQPLAEELGGVQQRIFGLADDIRRLSHRLHPAVLEHAGLMAALKSFTEEFSKAEGIAVMLEVPEGRNVIPREVGVCVYRVVQEWLRNIGKHAQAKSAEVSLSITNNNLHLVIKDYGRGFDVERARGSGLGLVSIEERVRLWQGTVEVKSQLGQGTTLTACIPLGAV